MQSGNSSEYASEWYDDGTYDDVEIARDEVCRLEIDVSISQLERSGDYQGHIYDHYADIERDVEQWVRGWSWWQCLRYLDAVYCQ